MYTQDYDGYCPIAALLPSATPDKPRICDVLAPYLKSQGVFKCLSDNKGYYESEGSSYEYYVYLGGKKRDRGRNIKRATRIWVFYDYEDFHGQGIRNFVYLDGYTTHEPIAQIEED